MSIFEKVLVCACVLLGAPVVLAIVGALAVLVYEQGASESTYPYTGFTPDCPYHEDF